MVINGTSDVNLAGHICECTGLGDNTSNGLHNRLRITRGPTTCYSRDRVIAIINSLQAFDPSAFTHDKVGTNTQIRNASIIVTGEPMGPVPAGPVG